MANPKKRAAAKKPAKKTKAKTKAWTTTAAGQRKRTTAAKKARQQRNTKKGYYPNPVRPVTPLYGVAARVGGRRAYFVALDAKGAAIFDTDKNKATAMAAPAALSTAVALLQKHGAKVGAEVIDLGKG